MSIFLKYEDLLKLYGIGWIEYWLPITAKYPQLSIEINANRLCSIIYVPNTGDFLPDYYEFCPNVPEAFKYK
ncbi:hypothetical protein RhiirA4_480285 [Rhizophagus irregularis]|uniref:Uncharacterized protein n=1 Tax=Rhizophagus irregularis TaxID=588596 RepID=A0A2I1HHQ8_9GLOM|nr:hypothetical protein RhiirA4_480285 [Rhizophagus irregularis]